MVFFVPVFILGLLVTISLADLDPKYQKPQNVSAVSYAGIEPSSCGASSFSVLTGQGAISPDDCMAIMDGWVVEGDFVLLATGWVSSTGDADHFYIYETQGTCQFAFERIDAMQNDVNIGSSDLIKVVYNSIHMQGGSQNQNTTIQPVEGVMDCNSTSGDAQVEWTIRKTF
ncbi:hypothetical protein N0V82_001937 [Gnomoniopsis sp. IMI 355080]|nr:hypothetical protein N0V82_001937 [Gnomoniopsis sp. IMI 355080]